MCSNNDDWNQLEDLANIANLATLAMSAMEAYEDTTVRRWWVRPINRQRPQQGAADSLKIRRTEDSLPRENNPAGSSGAAVESEVATPSEGEMEPPQPSTSRAHIAETPTTSNPAPLSRGSRIGRATRSGRDLEPLSTSEGSRIARATRSGRELEPPSTSENRPTQASQLRRQMYFESIEAWRNISETAEAMRTRTRDTPARSPFQQRYVDFMTTALSTLPENAQESFLNDILEVFLRYRREYE